MFGLVVYRKVAPGKVFVCSGDIGVSSLVACNYYTLTVGKVANTAVLQAVELERRWPVQILSELKPFPTELLTVPLSFTRAHFLAKQVTS